MKLEDIRRMAHTMLEGGAVESDHLEYKKSAAIRDGILKTACAYANNYMNREIGLILIGVEEVDDDQTGEKAVPVRPISGIRESMIESTENTLKSLLAHIHPRINYHLLQDVLDGRIYIILAVEPGKDGPYETDSRAEREKKINLKAGRYIRVRRDTRKPNRREEFALLKKFADYHFTSELNEMATLDDLNYEYMREYLVRTHAADDIRKLPKLEMARALNLIEESEYGGYRAKNFAVLMFADRPQDFIPYARVEVIREAVGTDKMESRAFDGPIWIQAMQVRNYFRDVFLSSYTVREPNKPGAHVVCNWPLATFEELSTNCILHKEYGKAEYVGIYIYRDHIAFINHNRPLPPVTIEDLNESTEFQDRQYLNVELKEMFFKLGLIQSYGSGIRRAKMALEENGSPRLIFEPRNKDEADYTMVTMYINEEFARIREEEERGKGGTITTQETSPKVEKTSPKVEKTSPKAEKTSPKVEKTSPKVEKTSPKTRDRILLLLKENPTISLEEIAQRLNLSIAGVKYHTRRLGQQKVIERVGGTHGGHWVVHQSHDD